MSLSGLLSVIADAPQLRRALGQADAVAADFIGPPALRPFLAATLAAPPGQPRRFVLAVTATAREAEDLTTARWA